jgi:acetyltransferase-like isoleucine patch superfamily enzyme
VRRDHRPFPVKRLFQRFERAYADWFIRPQLETMGGHCILMKPWNIRLHGPGIYFGEQIHVVTASDRKVRLCVWEHQAGCGRIDVGDYSLICPGVRIDSATHIEIGANTMIAAGAYITDADWHDLYDRSQSIGTTAKVTLGENVWVGDGATVCKGVTVGRNSIIGAGALVASDVPENVIVGGNPAKIIKSLDPEREIKTREALLHDAEAVELEMIRVERYMLHQNTLLGWLKSLIKPGPND